MSERETRKGGEAGFSLIELLLAMTVTMVLMALASGLLARCVNIRTGEDARTDALADVQRALNIIAREVATAGYGLSSNGIVGCSGANCDSTSGSLRFRANLDGSADGTLQESEDVKYFLNNADNTTYLVRYDANVASNKASVLANRIDTLQFFYYDQQVSYSTATFNPAAPTAALITNVRGTNGAAVAQVGPTSAAYVVVAVALRLPAVGQPGSESYQPAKSEMLVTDIALRNSDLTNY
ncbi:MAG TPA: prepilin-type N-terminal cleavage/methylation domain-containing protein [Pyrinomonadaceae bacterium]|nr:prepilin-type N-terminal cleavage/methylation domain-containing protein [Pyrinomonadaceae bacterium]